MNLGLTETWEESLSRSRPSMGKMAEAGRREDSVTSGLYYQVSDQNFTFSVLKGHL
jgi:hypothetical protein